MLPDAYLLPAASRYAAFLSPPPSAPAAPVKAVHHDNPTYVTYASAAHAAYLAFKELPRKVAPATPMRIARRTGRGEPRSNEVFVVRGKRWEARHVIERERLAERGRVLRAGWGIGEVFCGVPDDVIARRAGMRAEKEMVGMVEEMQVEIVVDNEVADGWWWGGGQVGECGVRKAGSGTWAARARGIWEAGGLSVTCLGKRVRERGEEEEVVVEVEEWVVDVDDVRRRYTGKPDELYRRRTARRWAVWRRAVGAAAAAQGKVVACAEREMKRRRGADMLDSASGGDVGFKAYGWDNKKNCYMFCDKITEKKGMREGMLRKYGEVSTVVEMSRREKAEEMAQTKELFHTRVMNRFT